MSARSIRVPLIYCDAPLDGADAPPCMLNPDTPYGITSVRTMRRYLRSQGWHTLKGGRDICPECWREGFR
jgi:hypothetical protein